MIPKYWLGKKLYYVKELYYQDKKYEIGYYPITKIIIMSDSIEYGYKTDLDEHLIREDKIGEQRFYGTLLQGRLFASRKEAIDWADRCFYGEESNT